LSKVVLKNGESQEKLLRRFRKVVMRSGKLGEVRKRRWFISKREQRRIEKKKTIRRLKRKNMKRRERGW
jgi:ribosomal protein S21